MSKEYTLKIEVVKAKENNVNNTAKVTLGSTIAPVPKKTAKDIDPVDYIKRKGRVAKARMIQSAITQVGSTIYNYMKNEQMFQAKFTGDTRQSQIIGNKKIIGQKVGSTINSFVGGAIASALTGNPVFVIQQTLDFVAQSSMRWIELQQELNHFRKEQALQNHITTYQRSRLINNTVKNRGLF